MLITLVMTICLTGFDNSIVSTYSEPTVTPLPSLTWLERSVFFFKGIMIFCRFHYILFNITIIIMEYTDFFTHA
jgi:hypothetical protein